MGLITKRTASRIQRLMPRDRIHQVQLRSQGQATGGQASYLSPVTWTACRQPANEDTVMVAGGAVDKTWLVWELYMTGGQTIAPIQLDRIIDDLGYGFDVKSVSELQFQVVYDCHCKALQWPPPIAPTNLVLTPASGGFGATWTPSPAAGTLFDYNLQWSLDSINWNALTSPVGGSSSASVSGLANGTTLQVRLQAVDNYGQLSTWVAGSVTTT